MCEYASMRGYAWVCVDSEGVSLNITPHVHGTNLANLP